MFRGATLVKRIKEKRQGLSFHNILPPNQTRGVAPVSEKDDNAGSSLGIGVDRQSQKSIVDFQKIFQKSIVDSRLLKNISKVDCRQSAFSGRYPTSRSIVDCSIPIASPART